MQNSHNKEAAQDKEKIDTDPAKAVPNENEML